jgi:dethiobiotin synthetase
MTSSTTPPIIVVTGTGTDVGKTIVTAAIAANACGAGSSVAVVKPAQTGVSYDMAGDVEVVGRLVGAGSSLAPSLTLRELIRYDHPLAPATAARVAGRESLTLAEATARVTALAEGHDVVVVEGAGGLNVRFSDEPQWTLADLASALDAPIVLVSHAGLGTLNHTSLTLEAAALRGLRVAGVVIGSWPADPDLAALTNLDDLALLTGAPIIGALPEGLAALDSQAFHAAAQQWLSPALGGRFDGADFTATNDAKDLL